MGTRGYYCYKLNGIYYVFYNHFDSYPEGLGLELLKSINGIDLCCKDAILKFIMCSINNYVIENPPYRQIVISGNAMSGSSNWDCEWIYVLDFDKKLFQVEHFKERFEFEMDLCNVPCDWIEDVKIKTP
jgi:hypothetical protein